MRVDELIQRGRSQGHLSLSELRTAFERAGIAPAEGRSILRELADAGVRLADERQESAASAKRTLPKGATEKATAAKGGRRAKKADDPEPAEAGSAAAEADTAVDTDDVAIEAEAEAAAMAGDRLSEVDLDDQTPAMGDSVHKYLKSI